MTTSLVMAAWLLCAQIEATPSATPSDNAEIAPKPYAASRIDAVTVYRGQALVTREVNVPDPEGAYELVVGPLPKQVVESSLYAEGSEDLRVVGTRSRVRTVADDSRKEVKAKQEEIKSLEREMERIEKEILVKNDDIQLIHRLEGFTGVALNNLADKGRIDSREIINLSRFFMDDRATKSMAEVELDRRGKENQKQADLARRALQELVNLSARTVTEGVIVVQKKKPKAGTVRFSYLVNTADWQPQYRLRGTNEPSPVRLEYLADVRQQTGESWSGVHLTLSNAKPTLDSAPPDLLPLKMVNINGTVDGTEADVVHIGTDERSRKIVAEFEKRIDVALGSEKTLDDAVKFFKAISQGPALPDGIPIYIDPVGLADADVSMTSPISFDVKQVTFKTAFKLILDQLGLIYSIRDGLVIVKPNEYDEVDEEWRNHLADQSRIADTAETGSGSLSIERSQGGARLNHFAADDQARELSVSEGRSIDSSARPDKDTPSVTFHVEGLIDIPSGPDPQSIEVARIELPAEFYAKAVPVLTPRVYRLAKLTNTSEQVFLPGEASVYVGTDFVGRMRLPLVAAGEPFIAGFGVDPQVQVSRRLVGKSKTVQGGNQIYTYEFRLGLRNYRSTPVKIQLWDRMPKPDGEAVAVNLTETSIPVSTEPLYLRTARLDNLLQWDIPLPEKTVGEKTLYLNYEFRLEYSRDLATPKFDSGGLREGPIGGGAMGGGMGGMGGGMRSTGLR